MPKEKFCRSCGAEFSSEKDDDLCFECQTSSSKTRTCLDCGDLIEDSESRYLCKRCRIKKGPADRPALPVESPKDSHAPKKKKILLIDDDASMRQLLRMRLQQQSYEVLEASDGREGYDKIKEEAPDLVVSDIMMPNMTGYDLIQRLKEEIGPVRNTPVIIMTAKSGMKEFFSDWRIHSFLIKPFDPGEFAVKVQELLDISRDWSPE